ncbi:PEPxxWA-CTERM sorting domain-containing protein [Sphingomonas sp.]|uniref:PEPxxWA-CTERM sorting domain-containing protein n=1 Tax=Sphingomonas sp. TaxID=28214 RepID=UPI0038ACC04C
MRRVLMTALAAATMLTAVPAFAVPTLVQQTGPDLNVKIYASGDAGFLTTSNPAGSTQDQSVYGNTSPGAGHNVSFTGYTSFNGTTLGTGTSINITGGNGFAQIADANGVNPTGQNPTPSENDLFALVMNPAPDFYLYEFSIQQFVAGNVSIYYDLAGGGVTWLPATGNPIMNGNGDTQYIFGDANNINLAIDSILILSSTAINHVKQNSIQTTGTAPLPEPATWAMMLLGFGGIGMAMRRSRRRNGVLMQVA